MNKVSALACALFALLCVCLPAAAASPDEAVRLSEDLRNQRPPENSSVNAVLKLRDNAGERTEVPVRLQTELIDATTWRAVYETSRTTNHAGERLVVTHRTGAANGYQLASAGQPAITITGGQLFAGFAGSDFSPADLGLEFLHWPAQSIVKSEMRRGRACKVLESAHPAPPAGAAYVRVRSWVDNETGGLLRAEAFDARGRLVKEFNIRSFKKVDGRWQLREMEIVTLDRDSRTRLEFELTVDPAKPAAQ